jgi:putative DNA primase/helicase
LQAEWPGILAWAITGCVEWREIGLAPPSAVTEAIESYLTDEDAVGRFIAERCECHPHFKEESQSLYAEWKRFSEASGEAILSQKSFNQKLAISKRGNTHERDGPAFAELGFDPKMMMIVLAY